MSTFLYGVLTTKRYEASPKSSTNQSPPGIRSYIDALAALVPSEVLALHAIILQFTTETNQDESGNPLTTITDPGTLSWAFFGLILLCIFLFIIPRISQFRRLDIVRAIIPPASFVAWTMIQKTTAFDALCPNLAEAPRVVSALFLAVIFGVVTTQLSNIADRE